MGRLSGALDPGGHRTPEPQSPVLEFGLKRVPDPWGIEVAAPDLV
jgi:hypothetical protein